MGSATKLAPIADVNSGVRIPHTSIVTRVGKTINAGNLTMMSHGVTLPILTCDGRNVIATSPFGLSDSWFQFWKIKYLYGINYKINK